MNKCDYRRLVSYIYSYPGGARDCNVGFAKAELRDGLFSLNVSLTCLRRDVPEAFMVCLMFGTSTTHDASDCDYLLLPIGSIVVSRGRGEYRDIFNPDDIASSGYAFCEIKGIAVIPRNDNYFRCFSLWYADDIDVSRCKMLEKGYRKCDSDSYCESELSCGSVLNHDSEYSCDSKSSCDVDSISNPESSCNTESSCDSESPCDVDLIYNPELSSNTESSCNLNSLYNTELSCNLDSKYNSNSSYSPELHCNSNSSYSSESPCDSDSAYVTSNNDNSIINAFDDDYYYDCTEITPNELDKLLACESFAENSFVMHQFHRYNHLLLGKVADNNNGAQYFIGVPGMYSNKERQFALMFGFNSFKKSHRSDYRNPYFGYWYMEV